MEDLPKVVRRRIEARISGLRNDPRGGASKKLVMLPGFRLRVGDYRILYEIDDEQRAVRVAAIKHRREAYR
jgi:mRNA interferase RelE/StbE